MKENTRFGVFSINGQPVYSSVEEPSKASSKPNQRVWGGVTAETPDFTLSGAALLASALKTNVKTGSQFYFLSGKLHLGETVYQVGLTATLVGSKSGAAKAGRYQISGNVTRIVK